MTLSTGPRGATQPAMAKHKSKARGAIDDSARLGARALRLFCGALFVTAGLLAWHYVIAGEVGRSLVAIGVAGVAAVGAMSPSHSQRPATKKTTGSRPRRTGARPKAARSVARDEPLVTAEKPLIVDDHASPDATRPARRRRRGKTVVSPELSEIR